MSFSGKKYQKVRIENLIEVLDKLNVDEKTFSLMRLIDNTSIYEKNEDGSVQFMVKNGDEVVMKQRMEDNKEVEFINPHGVLVKTLSKIEGDVVKTIMVFPNEKQIQLNRYFEENSMRMEVIVPGFDTKGVVYFKAV